MSGALLIQEDRRVLFPRRVWTFDFGQSGVVNCFLSVFQYSVISAGFVSGVT